MRALIVVFVVVPSLSLALKGSSPSASVRATPFTDCGSEGRVEAVEVVPCSETECVLERGKNATINLAFTPSTPTSTLSAIVHGVIAGFPIRFSSFPLVNACEGSGLTCPLEAGETYNYSVQLHIEEKYPKLSRVYIRWMLQDENGKYPLCVKIPAKLV